MPAGATKLELELKGDEGKETTALLSLKKGLYVKLYCIANQSELVNPIDETKTVGDDEFIPLQLSDPANGPVTIVGTGAAPEESTFLTFHTPLLNATTAGDTLTCPLPMSGAYTTPLDLTDFATSARMQAGFKLTRMVARFDIINKAATSRFTITEVSMGKGRRGAGFFPVKVYGTQPTAAAGELITYPARVFWGEKANTGIQTGAFYCYPSPEQDQAYLVLKGKYKVNQTEEKDVTYQVPFRSVSDGNGNYIEIAHNHRYTVAITDADEYHLDFTIRVSDWADDGSIDDYEPENTLAEITVTIPEPYKDKIIDTYDADRNIHTVSMPLKEVVDFTVNANATFPVQISKSYGTSGNKYDWLKITEIPSSRASGSSSVTNYKFSVADGYNLNIYPRCTVRLFDMVSGSETVLYVEGQFESSMEQLVSVPSVPVDNVMDADNKSLTFYTLSDAPSTMTIKVISYGNGSTVESSDDAVLKVVKAEAPTVVANTRGASSVTQTGRESYYTLIAVSVGTATLTLSNLADKTKEETYSVNVISSEISASDQEVAARTNGNTNIPVTSLKGVTASVLDWGDGGEWFNITTADVNSGTQNIVITQKSTNTSTVMKRATIRLSNKIVGGWNKDITIKPILAAPKISSSGYTKSDYTLDDPRTFTFTVTVPPGKVGTISSSNTNIATVSVSGTKVTVTPKTMGICNIIVPNASDDTKQSIYKVNLSGRTYNGAFVWKARYGGFYIAPTNAGGINWNNVASRCTNKTGATWVVPSADEWRTIIGGEMASDEVRNYYMNKGIISANSFLWSSTGYDATTAYYLYVNPGGTYMGVTRDQKAYGFQVRCVSRP